MSRRITRSAARLAAETPSAPGTRPTSNSTSDPSASSQSRKRKATTRREKASPEAEQEQHPLSNPSPRRTKRLKTATSISSHHPPQSSQPPAPRQSRRQTAMSQARPSVRQTDDTSKTRTASSSSASKQKSARTKKSSQGNSSHQTSPSRHQRKRKTKRDSDATMKDADDIQDESVGRSETDGSSSNNDNHPSNNSGSHNEDHGDPFRSHIFGSRSPLELQSTLRALSGMMSGISSRLRDILVNLKMKDDPSMQLIALQELSDLLLVSNEDTLAGHFAADSYVKELVALMEPSETGEENPEIMLLACRCLANLMEAIRGSVANVVYGGAVPVLCRKLLDIQFIDLAEQALSTLAKISVDFPASIVREGGLTACLTYLDFFPTSTQRTAVTTAANCCRNLPTDSFHVVRDVMPTLLHVLSSSDQKVVEQGCLCVCRVVESFKYNAGKLEELINAEMLRAILRLLLPGTTNLIGSHIHTQFLRVLGIICRSSPHLSMELLKMDVVDTLYQILTGVSPPSDFTDGTIKIDSVHIMQALIHRPREQVYETLNVICELLPGIPGEEVIINDRLRAFDDDLLSYATPHKAEQLTAKRVELLKSCKQEMKKFATILLPTLTDTFSSTVNVGVRQKVLLAQLKMLQYLDVQIIEDALRNVPYASFLAAILSQDDHASLVALALRCAELLFRRLKDIYQYQFHREGVITEITRWAERPLPAQGPGKKENKPHRSIDNEHNSEAEEDKSEDRTRGVSREEDEESHEDEEYNDDYDEENDHDRDQDDVSESDDSSASDTGGILARHFDTEKLVTDYAKDFLRLYEGSKGAGMHDKALEVIRHLKSLTSDIARSYKCSEPEDGYPLFQKLSSYFGGDAIESITSAELLNSGVIQVLLDVIGDAEASGSRAKTDFLRAFMAQNVLDGSVGTGSSTPFGVLIHKLQDLLSRTEHFEVITVHHGSYESRNTASMLSKQLRLRLIAEDDSDIPKPYKNIMVSIHAIANFKALDEYLRPRISVSERSKASRHRDTPHSRPGNSSRSKESPVERMESNTVDRPSSSQQPSSSSSSKLSGAPRSAKIDGQSKTSTSSQPATPGGSQNRSGRSRRSTRRQPSPPPPPEDEMEESDAPLECADERQLSDDDDEEEEEDVDGALDAIVDDLEGDLSESSAPDPTAVNMEVASSGKVTARRDDGTKVATPSQLTPAGSSTSTSTSAAQSLRSSLALAGRPFSSYAAAMASIPQDWYIQFSIDGKPILHDTTVYRAIHHNRKPIPETSIGNVWSNIHTIRFKRVKGPPPAEPSRLSPTTTASADPDTEELPESLTKATTTATILRLLRVLHRLNSQLDYLLAEAGESMKAVAEPLAQFINTKLTAKLNRQLEEPLIVASSCLPNWSEDLARHFPFLFPFETRHLFLQSTSFGYARSMMRWQGSHSGDDNRRDQRRDDRPFARLQRQKVRISRSRILDSALKVMELYGSSPSILEVEYFEEVGTGLGPTLEFYSTVSKEFSKKKLKLWREHESGDGEYVYSKLGLFPAPLSPEQSTQDSGKKILNYFKGLGKFVARSMLDSRIIDIAFNPTFFWIGNNIATFTPSISAIKTVDPDLAKSLMVVKQFANAKVAIESHPSLTAHEKARALQEFEVDGAQIRDFGLDFTLPGYSNIQLLPDGENIPVTIENVDLYVDKVIDMTLGAGVRLQIDAFRSGFSQVFSYSALKAFTPNELVMLFGQVEEDWSIETLMDSMKADHGFNMDSRSVRNLLETMSQFTLQQRRDFLQFVTGSPKLPIGGFKSLTPMFTVVCRPSEPPYISDDYLPSVMTCVNYLKLPDYSSAEILQRQLDVAMHEGQGAFHLS
ncbi:Ubiquitin fusion degradation protein 4 [Emydomyces testavorans]|uniref:HECT-type E3 ubiquitin transferase n=1 Tax=Emydomyces testavorans TaxID=2070801 RepID=A0AAF0DJG7_9EURO|nr:Ubiquitin fusion degradation protein 4 [Emydomyces testavorans]